MPDGLYSRPQALRQRDLSVSELIRLQSDSRLADATGAADADDDSQAIEANIKKARMKWALFKRLLTRENASRRVMGCFYKAIVQSVLLYGSETWVISAANMNKLSAFHHGCARFISNRHIRPDDEGIWTYPSNESVLEDAGLFTMGTYIQRRRDTIFNFVKDRPIYQRCLESEAVANSKTTYWWEQHFSELNT